MAEVAERAANKAVKAFEFGVNVVAELPRAYWDTAKEGRQADSLSGFVKGITGLPTQAAYGHQDEFARGGVIGKVSQQAVVQTTVAAATGGAGTFTKVLVETAVDTAYGDNPIESIAMNALGAAGDALKAAKALQKLDNVDELAELKAISRAVQDAPTVTITSARTVDSYRTQTNNT